MALAFGGQGPISHTGHRSVLLRETIELLAAERGGLVVVTLRGRFVVGVGKKKFVIFAERRGKRPRGGVLAKAVWGAGGRGEPKNTPTELATLVERKMGEEKNGRTPPATRTFQAL